MRIVVQRVKEAHVKVDGKTIGQIPKGLLVLLGIEKDDEAKDADYLVQKILQLRIFEDDQGKMNLASTDVHAQFLVVSQFTLYGDCRQGRRPSFDRAADPKKGEELYEYFVKRLRSHDVTVETGQFRAMMDVSLTNNGPVTFIIDSR